MCGRADGDLPDWPPGHAMTKAHPFWLTGHRNAPGTGTPTYKHGHTRSAGGMKWCSPTYKAWSLMVARCTNPRNASWESHGGRGITVCARWSVFENFLADMGERPPGLTLERQDNGKGYEPGNCVWATQHQQARNRRTNRMLTFDGRTMCVTDWARERGLDKATLRDRLNRGWTIERALA